MNKNNKIFLKNALPLFALFSSISSLLFANIYNTPIIHEPNEPFYISDGGSYIIQDGIIVLSDEDVEKYYKGTLEFHLFGEISE